MLRRQEGRLMESDYVADLHPSSNPTLSFNIKSFDKSMLEDESVFGASRDWLEILTFAFPNRCLQLREATPRICSLIA